MLNLSSFVISPLHLAHIKDHFGLFQLGSYFGHHLLLVLYLHSEVMNSQTYLEEGEKQHHWVIVLTFSFGGLDNLTKPLACSQHS